MASPRTSDIKARTAVLGLLIEKPDSVARLVLRLEEEYPTSGWKRNIVHNTLPVLVEKGQIRVTMRGPALAWAWCEPTAVGEEVFARWLGESAAEPPPIRDALLAKLKYVRGPDQLADMVRDIEERERLTLRDHEAAVSRYRMAHSAGALTSRDDSELQPRIRAGLLTFELRELQARLKNLVRFREDLEDPTGRRDTLEDD
jgi:hypothetical protein